MSKRVTIEQLKEHLTIDKNALDDELEKQALVYFEICEASAHALSSRDELKQVMEVVDAEIADGIRTRAAKTGDKITEAKLSQEILLDDKHTEAYSAYLEAKKDADLWAALKESFSQKGFALRELAELYISGYFAGSGIRERQSKEEVEAQHLRSVLGKNRKPLNRKEE